MKAFGLVATEAHRQQLEHTWNNSETEALVLSTDAVSQETVEKLLSGQVNRLRVQDAEVLSPLCGHNWPKTDTAISYAVMAKAQDLLALRRRTFLLMSLAGCLTYVLDEHMANDFEVALTVSMARIAKVPTVGVIPVGAVAFQLPSPILSLTDLVVSGEAQPKILNSVLRSLTTEPLT